LPFNQHFAVVFWQVIHMPERGFREWDFRAIEIIVKELEARGLHSVTLSELDAAAKRENTRLRTT
jgi:hypothetical protein